MLNVLQGVLDDAGLNGLKVMVPLYYNMQVSENEAMTIQFVTNIQDYRSCSGSMDDHG